MTRRKCSHRSVSRRSVRLDLEQLEPRELLSGTPTVQIVASMNAYEGNPNVEMGVSLSSTSTQPVTVQYQTVPGGTAVASKDYTSTSGTVTIPAGYTGAEYLRFPP